MAEQILALFCNPPMAVARLGASPTPLEAYHWDRPVNPRTDGETVIVPAWSLEVLADGSVQPHLPNEIRFRDGELIRPVCPFVEIWARLGQAGSDETSWRSAPLTPALLTAAGATLANLDFTITARNLKASRRTQNGDLQFGTFPSIEIKGDDHGVKPILGVNPPGVATPLIPAGRSIPLGKIQVLKTGAQPTAGSTPWDAAVNVETIRLRFTPAIGLSYGGPEAAATNQSVPAIQAVAPSEAFLNSAAGWYRQAGRLYPFVQPGDTVDRATGAQNQYNSLGVVDDTCELRIEVALAVGGKTLEAHSNLFSAPPDFAPDRRPFLSIADELNDRAGDAGDRSDAMSPEELDAWIGDLFERIYEHVSLMNLDYWRLVRAERQMTGEKLAATPIPEDGVSPADSAMGSRDALRNRDLRVAAPAGGNLLPLTNHARERHRTLSDIDFLRKFVIEHPGRFNQLIRGPFEIERGEDVNFTSMRMPPFMRNSNAMPLTLSSWQYDLIKRWVADTIAAATGGPGVLAFPLVESRKQQAIEDAADDYRAQVLARLNAEGFNDQ